MTGNVSYRQYNNLVKKVKNGEFYDVHHGRQITYFSVCGHRLRFYDDGYSTPSLHGDYMTFLNQSCLTHPFRLVWAARKSGLLGSRGSRRNEVRFEC